MQIDSRKCVIMCEWRSLTGVRRMSEEMSDVEQCVTFEIGWYRFYIDHIFLKVPVFSVLVEWTSLVELSYVLHYFYIFYV
jgi:hypothetical protein